MRRREEERAAKRAAKRRKLGKKPLLTKKLFTGHEGRVTKHVNKRRLEVCHMWCLMASPVFVGNTTANVYCGKSCMSGTGNGPLPSGDGRACKNREKLNAGCYQQSPEFGDMLTGRTYVSFAYLKAKTE